MRLSLILGTAAGVALLAASPGAAQARLDFWTEFSAAPELPVLNEIVADFNAANPDVLVVHTGFENTPYETTLKTSFAGGNPADIVELNGGANMFQYAEAGQLVDLTDFVAGIADTIAPGIEGFYEFGGKHYGIPLGLSIGNLLYYNEDMLAAKGIDPAKLDTWEGLLEVAQAFKDDGVAPIAFGNSEGWPGNHIFNHLLRRQLSDEDYVNIALRTFDPSVETSVKWSDPDPVRAWELYRELLDKEYFTAGYLADDYPTASNLFLTGKAPLFSMGSWFIGNIEQTAPNGPFGIKPFPTVEGGKGAPDGLVTNGLVVTITAASEHPDEAKRFLAYLASEPVQKKWTEATQRLLPYTYDTSTWAYGDLAKRVAAIAADSSSAAAFLDMIEDQTCNVPWVWDASQGVLTGDLTPQDAGDGHEACVEQLLSSKGF